jgi:hypothetical protein
MRHIHARGGRGVKGGMRAQEAEWDFRAAAAMLGLAPRSTAVSPFQCIPVNTDTPARFRDTGRDDSGNAVRRIVASATGGFPCRHCLRLGAAGETMLLGSYALPRPQGIYWTPSPIFLHAEPCTRFCTPDEVAPIVRANGLVSVRAYDTEDQCLYHLGHVCMGAEVDGPLGRALDDPRTAFVNIHTARPGCLLTRVERRDAGHEDLADRSSGRRQQVLR